MALSLAAQAHARRLLRSAWAPESVAHRLGCKLPDIEAIIAADTAKSLEAEPQKAFEADPITAELLESVDRLNACGENFARILGMIAARKGSDEMADVISGYLNDTTQLSTETLSQYIARRITEEFAVIPNRPVQKTDTGIAG